MRAALLCLRNRYVRNEMLEVNALLGLPAHGGHLALHWYEWDTLGYALGSNRKRSSPLCVFSPSGRCLLYTSPSPRD